MIRVAIDSNILAYLEAAWVTAVDQAKGERSRRIVATLRARVEIVVPVQALGELVVVMRRTGIDYRRAREAVQRWSIDLTPAPSTPQVLADALDIAERHTLQFWDSMILAASLEAGCSLLLSEDMQDGFKIGGLTVANPLLDQPHEKLAGLLQD